MIVYEVRKSNSGKWYAAKTVIFRSLQRHAILSIPTRVVLNTKKAHDKGKRRTWIVQGSSSLNWTVVIVYQNILLLRFCKQQFQNEQHGTKKANIWRQRQRTPGTLSKNLNWNGKCNFYQSWKPHKERLCSNLRTHKEKTLLFCPKRIAEWDGIHIVPLEVYILLDEG